MSNFKLQKKKLTFTLCITPAANNHLKPVFISNYNCNCHNSNNECRGRGGNSLEEAEDEGVESHAVVVELRELAHLREEAVENTSGRTCEERDKQTQVSREFTCT